MKFTQIRHGTCIIELDNTRFILDPILYKKNTIDPIKGGVEQKNPLTDITVGENILKDIDIILLTHLHKDHFDSRILNFYGRNIPIICSNEYKEKMLQFGFSNVSFLKSKDLIKNFEITITNGKHGFGAVGKSMGKSFGFIIKSSNGDVIYITGDTIWCSVVEKTIEKHKPNIIIGFAGSAIIEKKHITLDDKDINCILKKAPNAKVIVNHMDAWNHCTLTKKILRNSIRNDNLLIPNDGEIIVI